MSRRREQRVRVILLWDAASPRAQHLSAQLPVSLPVLRLQCPHALPELGTFLAAAKVFHRLQICLGSLQRGSGNRCSAMYEHDVPWEALPPPRTLAAWPRPLLAGAER